MTWKFKESFLILVLVVVMLAAGGCGGGGGGSDSGGPVKPENIEGDAILDIRIVDGGSNKTPPAPPAGYALLDIDLNGGNTGGNYIWLYYKVGKADGSEGDPISKIYTVDEFDGEKDTQGGTQLPVNLNNGDIVKSHEPLWLYYIKSDWPVVRCIAVYQRNGTSKVVKYGPPEAAGQYDIVWVEELLPDDLKSPYDDIPPDAQDLNEGQSNPFILLMSDYIYIGYGID